MRLSRHAKNEMRLYGISVDDVERTAASSFGREMDDLRARQGVAVLSLSWWLGTTPAL